MAPARRGKKEWKNAYCLGDEDRQGNQKEKKKKKEKNYNCSKCATEGSTSATELYTVNFYSSTISAPQAIKKSLKLLDAFSFFSSDECQEFAVRRRFGMFVFITEEILV